MTYNVEQITYMLAEAIDQDREYKSWHVSTKHLMTLVEMVVAQEREACAKVCEDVRDKYSSLEDPAERIAVEWCLDLIRERGQA